MSSATHASFEGLNPPVAPIEAPFADVLLDQFPEEIRQLIFSSLNYKGLFSLLRVNRELASLRDDNYFWSQLIDKDFGKEARPKYTSQDSRACYTAYRTDHFITRQLLSKEPTQTINPPGWGASQEPPQIKLFHISAALNEALRIPGTLEAFYHAISNQDYTDPRFLTLSNILGWIKLYLEKGGDPIATEEFVDSISDPVLRATASFEVLLFYKSKDLFDDVKRCALKIESIVDKYSDDAFKGRILGNLSLSHVEIQNLGDAERVAKKIPAVSNKVLSLIPIAFMNIELSNLPEARRLLAELENLSQFILDVQMRNSILVEIAKLYIQLLTMDDNSLIDVERVANLISEPSILESVLREILNCYIARFQLDDAERI